MIRQKGRKENMKFTKGFWLVRDEYRPDYVRDFYAVEESKDAVRAYAPYKKIDGRGDTLNVGMMTFTITAPQKDVLGIHMQNHAGNYVTEPAFRLCGEIGKKPEFTRNGDDFCFRSGDLSLTVHKGDPQMHFFGRDREITCLPTMT